MKPGPPLTVHGEPRAFFGRRSGKRLHRGQDVLFGQLLPRLAIEPGEAPLDMPTLFAGSTGISLEIGFGGGEHLVRQAAAHPQRGYLGCEVFSGGIAKLLQAVDAEGLDNIRVFTDDALKLLQRAGSGVFEEIFVLYPDPWPKTRHHKRRFISPLTVAEMARTLRTGGRLRLATDIPDYADWALAHLLRHPGFVFSPAGTGGWTQPFSGWQPTRYEAKARREGRAHSWYLEFVRVDDGSTETGRP